MTCPGVRASAPLALAMSIGFAAAGCATVKRARAFQDPASATPGERTPTAAEIGLSSSGPVELELLIQKALEVNPTVLGAHRNVEITRAHVLESEAALYPQLSASAAGGWRDSEHTPSTAELHRFLSYGFDLSWLLFDFGRTKAQTKSLGELWIAAQHDFLTAELDVAFNVRNAYINLSRQVALSQVADETVRQFEARLDQVKAFVEVGKRIPYDETKAEVDLGTARLAQVRTHDAVLAAQATLANSIGLAEVVDWEPDFNPTLPAVPEDFDAAWGIAREHQPTLAAASARVAAASYVVDSRIAALYPSLNLSLSAGASNPLAPLPWIFPNFLWSWVIAPSLQYVIYDGGARIAAIDESVASLRSARAAKAQIEQGAWLDTRSAWLAVQDARQRIEVTSLTVENAKQQLELAQGLFAVGKNTSVDLADAQQVLAQSKADFVQAKADMQAAIAALARAIGIVVEEKPPDAVP